jgi:hypothetical protein
LTSFLTNFAFAGGPAGGPVTGAIATVTSLDLAHNRATMEIVNNSRKDITAYSVSIIAVYANGVENLSEKMEDYGPLFTSRGNDLHPGGVIELADTFGVLEENPLVRVDAKMAAIVYADRTAEVFDEEAFGRIQSHRSSAALALSKSVEILQRFLADPSSNHPGAAASAEIKRLSKLGEQTTGMDEVYLEGVREKLDEALQVAARSNVGERESVSQYLTELQQRAAQDAKYAQIKRAQ